MKWRRNSRDSPPGPVQADGQFPSRPNHIVSDTDYVDYITKLMGRFAIPDFLTLYRRNRKSVFVGLPLLRYTERMVIADCRDQV